MRDLDKYRGIIPAFYACYDENGTICKDRVRALTEYFVKSGVKGVYVNGSSGECIYQSVAEKKEVLEAVVEAAAGRLTIIAHVACNNTEDSRELATHAEKLGVDAIAAIPPIYFKLPEYAIAQYWNDISDAAPNTDFIIYNIPQLAGVSLTASLFAKMRENKRVVGVKNSSMPVQDIQQFKRHAGEDYVIFNGPDEQFISGRVIGAEGGIGGTYGMYPDLFLKMDELIRNDKLDAARKLQYMVNDIIAKMVSGHGNLYAMIKEVLRINENLDIGSVRKPLAALTKEDFAIAKEAAEMITNAREVAKDL